MAAGSDVHSRHLGAPVQQDAGPDPGDVLGRRLRIGRHALGRDELHAVGAAKITECVVGRDDPAVVGGNLSDRRLDLLLERVELGEIGLGVGLIGALARRVGLAQAVADVGDVDLGSVRRDQERARIALRTHGDPCAERARGDRERVDEIVGTVDDTKPSPEMRNKIGVYERAGYPNYPKADKNGYPPSVDVSKRLAMTFGNFPDYYETNRPKLDGPFVPSIKNSKGDYIANPQYKDEPGAVLRIGNLPQSADSGTHTADDGVLNASGPGAARVHGFMDNTEVFRTMVDALGLGRK